MTEHPTRRRFLKAIVGAAAALTVLLVATWGLTQAQSFREYQRSTEARSATAAKERQEFSDQVAALQREVRRLSNLLTARGIDPGTPASPDTTRKRTPAAAPRAATGSSTRKVSPTPKSTPKLAPSPKPRATPRPSPTPQLAPVPDPVKVCLPVVGCVL